MTIDRHHTIILFNRAAEKLFGFHREEVVGQDLSLIMSPRCALDHKAAVERYLITRNPRLIGHETEFITTRRNGDRFPATISFSVMEVDDESYFTAIIRDLSEAKELEEKVSAAQRLATLGQLVAEITHEIKNPLMLIGGFSNQLMGKLEGEADKRKLRVIIDEVGRLENLLSELKECYRPQKLNIEPVYLNDVFNEVKALIQSRPKKPSLSITNSSEYRNPAVWGDSAKLKQVFFNLTKNSLEAMKEDGRLTIETSSHDDIVDIRFRDTGPGISDELKEKIFTPFFTTKKHGTGLGLPLSKRIIEDHPDGSFQVTSKVREGTTVTVRLKLHRPEDPLLKHEH